MRAGQVFSDDDLATVLELFLMGYDGVNLRVLREAVRNLQTENSEMARMLAESPEVSRNEES